MKLCFFLLIFFIYFKIKGMGSSGIVIVMMKPAALYMDIAELEQLSAVKIALEDATFGPISKSAL